MKKLILMLCLCMTSAIVILGQTIGGRNFGLDGFAAYPGTPGTNHYLAGGTTGGAAGKVVVANDFKELQAYLQSSLPYVVLVNHDITTGITCYVDDTSTGHLCDVQDGSQGVATTYGERILVASNKTLIGIVDPVTGKAPLFSRITFVMQCVSNIIIRNCRFTMNAVPILKTGENKIVAFRNGSQIEVGDPDCIGIQADKVSASTDFGSHIWVDHCEFFNGDAANKDRYDGLLDCKNNVQWLTVSYNYFHDHDKSCLWGKGNSDIYDGCRTISAHHNYFENIEGSRLPLQRGGHVHYFNNYMNNCSDGWDLRAKAVGYTQGCYFKNTKAPVMPSGEGEGLNIDKTEGYDLIYDNCQRIIDGYADVSGKTKFDELYTIPTTTWLPKETASTYFVNDVDKTADVPALAEKYSGAGKIEIYKAYTETIPAEDETEFINAVSNAATGPTFDEDGNQVDPSSPTNKKPSCILTLSKTEVDMDGTDTNVELSATASDEDGTVTSLKIYVDDVVVASVENAGTLSYTYNCTMVGTHIVKAEAVDDLGKSAISTIQTIKATSSTPVVPPTPSEGGNVTIQSDNVPSGFDVDGSATVTPYVYSSSIVTDANLIKLEAGEHYITLPAGAVVTAATIYFCADNNTENKGSLTSFCGKSCSIVMPSRKAAALGQYSLSDLNVTDKVTFKVGYRAGVKLSLTVSYPTGISDNVSSESGIVRQYYTADGVEVSSPQKGLNVVVEKTGKTIKTYKVIVK